MHALSAHSRIKFGRGPARFAGADGEGDRLPGVVGRAEGSRRSVAALSPPGQPCAGSGPEPRDRAASSVRVVPISP